RAPLSQLLPIAQESDDAPEFLPSRQAGRAGCPITGIGDSFCSWRCTCERGCCAFLASARADACRRRRPSRYQSLAERHFAAAIVGRRRPALGWGCSAPQPRLAAVGNRLRPSARHSGAVERLTFAALQDGWRRRTLDKRSWAGASERAPGRDQRETRLSGETFCEICIDFGS